VERPAGPKNHVQVISRAAAIMRALEGESAGLSLGQIAERVKLARSTVQRIVAALEAEKLVMAASPNGRVRLGPTILRLAASVRTDFAAFARPFIVRLSNELHETVDLSSVRKDHLVFIDQVIGPQRLRTVSAVGDSFPLYCTANGKAYLSMLEDAAIDREEHTLGICAAGVALHDPLGNAVAISVPVPAQRFHEHERKIAERLLATKRTMEREMTAAAA
jgi:DNA-binding IclR family transcriptional regulator